MGKRAENPAMLGRRQLEVDKKRNLVQSTIGKREAKWPYNWPRREKNFDKKVTDKRKMKNEHILWIGFWPKNKQQKGKEEGIGRGGEGKRRNGKREGRQLS
jgi:hypothetical protein